MQISRPDFLVLSLSGINLFVETVDEMVQANEGFTFEQCARHLQTQIREYRDKRCALEECPVETPVPEPLTMTLADLLKRATCDWPAFIKVSRNVVYIIKDDDRILYVGSTRYNARSRIKSHERAQSPLGKALRTDVNRNNWSVEMIPHADYDSAFLKERDLIRELRPAFCRRISRY